MGGEHAVDADIWAATPGTTSVLQTGIRKMKAESALGHFLVEIVIGIK